MRFCVDGIIHCLSIQAGNKWKGLFSVGEEFEDEVWNVLLVLTWILRHVSTVYKTNQVYIEYDAFYS